MECLEISLERVRVLPQLKGQLDSRIAGFFFFAGDKLHRTFLYFQVLLLSKGALLKFSTGHVIDLVSNDVQRLEEETVNFFLLASLAFLEFVLTTFFLVYFIGWQTLMGVIFLYFLLPYFAALSYAGAALRLRTAMASDCRISLINQVVCGIRAIKTHAWEEEYRVKIKNTRR